MIQFYRVNLNCQPFFTIRINHVSFQGLRRKTRRNEIMKKRLKKKVFFDRLGMIVPKVPLNKTDIDNKLLPLIFNKKRNQSDNLIKPNGKSNKESYGKSY